MYDNITNAERQKKNKLYDTAFKEVKINEQEKHDEGFGSYIPTDQEKKQKSSPKRFFQLENYYAGFSGAIKYDRKAEKNDEQIKEPYSENKRGLASAVVYSRNTFDEPTYRLEEIFNATGKIQLPGGGRRFYTNNVMQQESAVFFQALRQKNVDGIVKQFRKAVELGNNDTLAKMFSFLSTKEEKSELSAIKGLGLSKREEFLQNSLRSKQQRTTEFSGKLRRSLDIENRRGIRSAYFSRFDGLKLLAAFKKAVNEEPVNPEDSGETLDIGEAPQKPDEKRNGNTQ